MDAVRAIAAGRYDGLLDEAEQTMLRFARQVANDASRITSGQVAELKQYGFSDAEVFDIAAAAAGRAFFTKLLDALGIEPDASFRMLDQPFRHALTVGRAIDCRPCVRLADASLSRGAPARTVDRHETSRRGRLRR